MAIAREISHSGVEFAEIYDATVYFAATSLSQSPLQTVKILLKAEKAAPQLPVDFGSRMVTLMCVG